MLHTLGKMGPTQTKSAKAKFCSQSVPVCRVNMTFAERTDAVVFLGRTVSLQASQIEIVKYNTFLSIWRDNRPWRPMWNTWLANWRSNLSSLQMEWVTFWVFYILYSSIWNAACYCFLTVELLVLSIFILRFSSAGLSWKRDFDLNEMTGFNKRFKK